MGKERIEGRNSKELIRLVYPMSVVEGEEGKKGREEKR